MLRVNNLYKKYKNAEKASINDLSFYFEKGKIIGLLGPNGAGKTTTISIISGLISQFKGDIKIYDFDVRKSLDEVKKMMSIVPQQIALYPTLSCFENLLYYGSLYNIPSKKLKEIIQNLLIEFGLTEHAGKQIKHFSGGMKRRANIIASLLNNPKILILDEPTAGVDVHSRKMILQFLKKYNEAGNSILYTSHLLEEAEKICDEVLIIDNGEKIIQGNPQEIIFEYNAKNLEDVFLKLTGHQLRD